MSDNRETSCYIQYLPTEILLKIFISLPVKDLTTCRAVCTRWIMIIDGLARSDDLWATYCKKDYSQICAVARKKAKSGLLWYNLYRSLTLWKKIADARDIVDEFSAASCLKEEIRGFEMLSDGVLGVHKKSSIVYYDTETLQLSKRTPISGDYSRYTENDKAIVILNFHLHCFLALKGTKHGEDSHAAFDNVKLFTLTEKALYFVTLDDEIFFCSFADEKLNGVFLNQVRDGVMSLGFSDGQLNILTFQRNIFTVVGKDLIYKCSLGPDSNLLHQLHKYNFLEQLDWRVYFQWMYVLNHVVPDGPLRDIIVIRPYGDVYFVGSNWGVLRIYYAPYSEGEFDLFKSEPVKQYNFMERSDCPVLSMCPILQVDVFEVEDGHTVFVAMPKKIAVLNFTHTFKRTATLAMLPYNEVQKVKFMKMNTSI